MPIKDSSPLKPKADGIEIKVRRRQSREAVPAYVVGISNGEWIVQGEDGTSGFSVPHNTGGLAIGQQVQKTRSNIPMFDFGSSSPVPTNTTTSVQTVSSSVSQLTSQDLIHYGADGNNVIQDEIGSTLTVDPNLSVNLSGGPYAGTPNSGYVEFDPEEFIRWTEATVPTGDFCVEMWVWIENDLTADDDIEFLQILDQSASEADILDELVDFNLSIAFATNQRINALVRNDTSSNTFVTTPNGTISLQTWHFIKLSVEGTSAELSVDGNVEGSDTLSGTRGGSFTKYSMGHSTGGAPTEVAKFRISDFRFTADRSRRTEGVPTSPLQNN